MIKPVKYFALVFFALTQLVLANGSVSATSATSATSLSQSELVAFMLPDGSLPVICGLSGSTDQPSSHGVCDGCFCDCADDVASSVAALFQGVFSLDDEYFVDESDKGGFVRLPGVRAPPGE